MKLSHLYVFILLGFICGAHAETKQAPMAGIPYRVLWHTYCLTQLSSNPENHLVLKSKSGINPEKFIFSPLDADGNPPVSCNSRGISVVRWVPEFDTQDTLIYVNQPKGSMDLTFKWNFTYDCHSPLTINLLFHGRAWIESSFHWLILKDEFPNL